MQKPALPSRDNYLSEMSYKAYDIIIHQYNQDHVKQIIYGIRTELESRVCIAHFPVVCKGLTKVQSVTTMFLYRFQFFLEYIL